MKGLCICLRAPGHLPRLPPSLGGPGLMYMSTVAYRMQWILSVRDVQCELFGRRWGRADGRSSLRAPATRPLCHSWLRLPRLFVQRSWPSRSHLLRPTLVSVRYTVTARPRSSLSERSHLLPRSHLPLRHRCVHNVYRTAASRSVSLENAARMWTISSSNKQTAAVLLEWVGIGMELARIRWND